MEHSHLPHDIHARIRTPSRTDYTRDLLYGGIDGAVTTFAVVAGVEGAGLSTSVIVIIGLANIFADGFSMAASNYTGAKAERDNLRRLRTIEERHIREEPAGEREEVRQILANKGLTEPALSSGVDAITQSRTLWIETMLTGEYGVSPIEPKPVGAAIATFAAFVVCGLIPLVPYLFGSDRAFEVTTGVTLLTFFGIGAAKSWNSMQHWFVSATETLAVGACAGGVAYGVGQILSGMGG